MKYNFLWSALLAALMMGCGGTSEETESLDDQENTEMVDGDNEVEYPETETYTPIDFKQLKSLLPASAAGMKLKQSMGSSESNSSEAMGNYDGGGGNRMVLITITDKANNETVSEESDMEVETDEVATMAKNVKIKGHPAYEVFTQEKKGTGTGSVTINVKNRFKVSIGIVSLSLEEARQVAESIDLDKLAAMK